VKLPRPYSKPWHYIGESNDFFRASKNDLTLVSTTDARDSPPESCVVHYPDDCGDTPSDGCVISAIANHTAIFMDTRNSKVDRKEALMYAKPKHPRWVVHW
jgi:hypothetical protein